MANKEKLLTAAQKFLQKNQLSKAIKHYEKALSLDERDFRCRQKLAELYSRKGEVDKAITHYEKVATYYVDHAFYLKAIAVYKQMQRLAPDNDAFTLKLGKLNEQQGLVGNALAEYRTLLKHYESQDDMRAAIDTLSRIRELDPENINAAARLANYYAQSGKKERAHETFAEVEEQLWKKGNYQQLKTFYEHFTNLWPEDVHIMAQQGHAMVEFGEPIGGVEYLTRLQRQYPDQICVLDRLAHGLRKIEDFERELGCLQKWMQLDPDDLDVCLRMCESALAADKTEVCFSALENAREKFFAAERVSEIKPLYERLHEMLPEDHAVTEALRAVYEHLGEGEKLFDILGGLESDDVETNVDEAPAESSGPGNQSYTSPDASASEFDATDFDDITFDTVDGDQDQLDLESFDLADTPAQNNIDVSTELEEVDFYLQQGLLDDAQEACERLQKSVPDDARVEQRLEKISQFRQRHEQAAVESSGSESGKADASYVQTRAEESASLDIALPEEKAGDDEALNKLDLSLDDDFDLDLEIPELADSQRGVQTKIGDEDTESAYNLGIAYKEMGLYSDAVEQFSKSKWDPARRVSSVMLEADCYKYMQQFEKAEEILADALSAPDLQMEERIALYYETGLLYEECDRYADALASYQVVVDNKPDFREVSQKVAELKKTLGVEDDSEDLSRVSYV